MSPNTPSTLIHTPIRTLRVQASTLADRLDAVRAAELAAGVTHPSCAFRGCASVATGSLHGVRLCACHEMAVRQREVAA